MLTTGYPRFQGDLFGFFVADLARALTARGHLVGITAPGFKGVPARDRTGGVPVRRVTYARPAGLMKLAYGGGADPQSAGPALSGRAPAPVSGGSRAVRGQAGRPGGYLPRPMGRPGLAGAGHPVHPRQAGGGNPAGQRPGPAADVAPEIERPPASGLRPDHHGQRRDPGGAAGLGPARGRGSGCSPTGSTRGSSGPW